MGLKDRILNFVARWGSPTMDHPAGGGMTGENSAEDDDTSTAEETE
jgi:hypothetical protein